VAFLLALLASAWVARQISEPVAQLAHATNLLAEGDRSQRIALDRGDELGVLVRSFNHLAESIERSETLRRRLVADVAHELRTPLTGLQGQIEAMQDGLAKPDPDGLASLHQDVLHLSGLVAELQDLALAEGNQLRLDRQSLDLLEEAKSAVRSLGLNDSDSPRVVCSGSSVTVCADRGRLRQVLTNLLANAAAHAPAGFIGVHVSVEASHGRVAVADDGPGVSEEDLPRIFERLYQADTRRRSRRGSGLGLSIVSELVRLHGGTVEVRSEVGRGTEFVVRIPRVAAGEGPIEGGGIPSCAGSPP
jgi:signal transduction histidine kinase